MQLTSVGVSKNIPRTGIPDASPNHVRALWCGHAVARSLGLLRTSLLCPRQFTR